jgi:type IV pilus assembly protein PilC
MSDPLDPIVTEALRSWRVQLEAGIPSGEALGMCSEMLRGSDAGCFREAALRTSKGEGIATVLDALTPLLTPGERAILAAGWAAGRIEPTLDSLVRQRELWRNTRRHILNKLIMPAATLVVASVIAPVPGLIAGSYGVPMYFVYAMLPMSLAVGLCTAAFLFFRARVNARVFKADGSPVPASNVDRLMLQLPLIGYIERQRSLAQAGDMLSQLLGAGAPIVQALDSTARAMGNGCYRQEMVRLSRAAAQGFSFAATLQEGPPGLWPREFCASVAVGQQSGSLDSTLAGLAKNARESYTRAIEIVAVWVPRLIYGAIAMFVVWNIFKMAFMYINEINKVLDA